MPPNYPKNLLFVETAGATSSLRLINLTGKHINLPSETLEPHESPHQFSSYLAYEKTLGGVLFCVRAFHLNPLQPAEPNVILIVSEEMARHYADRADVFYPLADEKETYHNGAPMRYRGLARFIPSDSIGSAAHPDGL